MKCREVAVPIYGATLMIFPDFASATRKYKQDMSSDYEAYVTTMERDGFREVAIVFRDLSDTTYNTMAHEALHAAWRILGEVGVKVDEHNHEALAYLLGWVVEQIETMRK